MEILLGLSLAVLAGIIPMVAYALVLWWFDRYEKEPLGLVTAVFVWGAVPSIFLALVIEVAFDIPIKQLVSDALAYELIGGSLVAPLAEEIFKGLAVLGVFIFFRHEFDSVLDGVIYGSLVGFGFATVENILYFMSELSEGGLGQMLWLTIVRAVVFGLNHAFFTSLTGIGFALARLSRSWLVKLGAPLAGLGLAIGAHAIHNGGMTLAESSCLWPLFSLTTDWFGVLVVFVVIVMATFQERGWLQAYLPEEVGLGVLSQAECRTVCSYLGRLAERAEALFSGDLGRWWRLGRFYQAATELAFKKHQLASLGDQAMLPAIQKLRRELATLR